MSAYIRDLARDVADDLRNHPPTHPTRLDSVFNDDIVSGKIIDLVGGDFQLWLIVYSLVQNWLIYYPNYFGAARDKLLLQPDDLHVDEPPRYEADLPPCLDPVFWNIFKWRRQHGL